VQPHEITSALWGVADLIRDTFKQGKYQGVILPLTVLRRIDCVLAPTRDKILERYHELKGKLENLDNALRKVSKHAFYNTSKFTFELLLNDQEHLAANLRKWIDGFSPNVRTVLERFEFDDTIRRLDRAGLLYLVIERFKQVDLGPDAIDNLALGTVFEEMIRRFNEALNENPGEHFTPREVIKLMVELMIAPDRRALSQKNVVRTVYDPCCGTGGMLTITRDTIREAASNREADIHVFGQEVNPETWAVCVSDFFLTTESGRDAENIAFGSSLSKDGHQGATFDYLITNPPYGRDWKMDEDAVEEESKRGNAGRFGAGTPRISDGQLLFLQHLVAHMKPADQGGGRAAILTNGSPLFMGDAGSGESEIRRWLIENDLVEAIVALPEQLFYNTGIASYIWLLSNRKAEERRGRVQLIDASGEAYWTPMRRSLGDKRRMLTDEARARVLDEYARFSDSDSSRIVRNQDLGFRKCRLRVSGHAETEKSRLDERWREFIELSLDDDPNEYTSRCIAPIAPEVLVDTEYTDPKAGCIGMLGYAVAFQKYFPPYSTARRESLKAEFGCEPILFGEISLPFWCIPLLADELDSNPCLLWVPRSPNQAVRLDRPKARAEAYFPVVLSGGDVDSRYVTAYLNSPLGREFREWAARGVAWRWNRRDDLNRIPVFLPSIEVQVSIVAASAELRASMMRYNEMTQCLWVAPNRVVAEIRDIRSNGNEWIDLLPFPLAKAYWKSLVDPDLERQSRERLEFFEVLATFWASLLLGAVARIRPMSNEMSDELIAVPTRVFDNVLKTANELRKCIDAPTMGIWSQVVIRLSAELRGLRREDEELVSSMFGKISADIVDSIISKEIGAALFKASTYRNDWKGHASTLGSDVARGRLAILDRLIGDVRKALAPFLARMELVRAGACEMGRDTTRYQCEVVCGTRWPLVTRTIETNKRWFARSHYLLERGTDWSFELHIPFLIDRYGYCWIFDRFRREEGVRVVCYDSDQFEPRVLEPEEGKVLNATLDLWWQLLERSEPSAPVAIPVPKSISLSRNQGGASRGHV
jgi:type I restriction enzyme M protein